MRNKLISLVLLFLFFITAGCSNDQDNIQSEKKEKKPETPPLPVEVIVVQKEKVPIWIEYTGKTKASQEVEVRARVAGRLEAAFFNEGNYVEKGKKLFSIEKTTYEAAVSGAKARLEGDQASMKMARADVDRYKPLVAEGLAPRVTLEQHRVRVMELAAAIKADRAALTEAELNLQYTDVIAPISGRIGRINIDVGNIVGYGDKTLLTTIIADDPMYAYFSPNEEQFQLVKQYRSRAVLDARVTVPDSFRKMLDRKPLKGVVDFNDNRVDGMTGTITMRAKVDNPDHDLMEGTFVYVDLFVTDQAEFIMIPPGIVLDDQRGSFVYTVDDKGTAKRVDISRGLETRNYLAVTDGLKGGEKAILSGLAKIRPGLRVDPTDVTESRGVIAILRKQGMIPEKE
ncbi:MexE family multidrug efflux RND transporter periplasmic adaptor subunit [Desulfomarina profundi]|uniref:MexE family multidrug efflux RND transporter periplasmic adaptor subunit n=1 Tax=Desulfomarina profundi TaxID=2772557 RepID=A0A8D5FLG3_9BACT|nr:efflux RND transporter periplasmic adaptor subunit [Desulfomarina profundi]BCL62761.1 MexE family multidrug efflux RND transporter periplasmic adaptor subunit [Desulfomarina profundi]